MVNLDLSREGGGLGRRGREVDLDVLFGLEHVQGVGASESPFSFCCG